MKRLRIAGDFSFMRSSKFDPALRKTDHWNCLLHSTRKKRRVRGLKFQHTIQGEHLNSGSKVLKIAAMPGDGIGKEVMPEGLRVLDAASRRFGFELQVDHINWRSHPSCCL